MRAETKVFIAGLICLLFSACCYGYMESDRFGGDLISAVMPG